MVFKILQIHFVCVALLKQIHSFFFSVPCLLIKDALSWGQLMILIVLWQIQMIWSWLIFFWYIRKNCHTWYKLQLWIISYHRYALTWKCQIRIYSKRHILKKQLYFVCVCVCIYVYILYIYCIYVYYIYMHVYNISLQRLLSFLR